MNIQTKKRGPGRPPKDRSDVNEEKIQGCVSTPSDNDNCVELRYGTPSDIKKMSTYFKNLSTEVVEIEFTETNAYFYGNHPNNTSVARVSFDGGKCIRYFCKEPIRKTVLRTKIEKILLSIDSDHTTITFIIQKINKDTKLFIVAETNSGWIEQNHVDIVKTPYQESFIDDSKFQIITEPALSFNLTCKYFKKLVTRCKTFGKSLTFQKIGECSPITIQYGGPDNGVGSVCVPTKSVQNLMKIVQTGDLNELFSVSAYYDDLTPVSKSTISKTMWLQLWTNESMFFTITLNDGAMLFHIRTKIIGPES